MHCFSRFPPCQVPLMTPVRSRSPEVDPEVRIETTRMTSRGVRVTPAGRFLRSKENRHPRKGAAGSEGSFSARRKELGRPSVWWVVWIYSLWLKGDWEKIGMRVDRLTDVFKPMIGGGIRLTGGLPAYSSKRYCLIAILLKQATCQLTSPPPLSAPGVACTRSLSASTSSSSSC